MTTGWVLAGGRSTRMGRDKAWVELAGRPLAEHAVRKLRAVCEEVFLLSGDVALQRFAPVVADVHPGCGPVGGMEAALLRTRSAWNVFVPVDVPFLPAAWLKQALERAEGSVCGVVAVAAGRMQPTVAVLHAGVLPFVAEAVRMGEYKLLPVLERAGIEVMEASRAEWFANLNTPEDLVEAQRSAHLLDI